MVRAARAAFAAAQGARFARGEAGLSESVDAIVIGAGLSGLVCARRLVDGGARVIIVEARDRVGGRLHSGRVGGEVVDLGGHLMTATQDRLAALVDELGVESAVPDRSGKQRFPKGGLFAALAQWRAVARIQRLIRDLGGAHDHGSQTLAEYLGRIRNVIARERLALHAELILALDPADVSLASYLERMRVTGGFAPQGELPGGGRERYLPGGAQELASRLARDLDVRLSSPVEAIEQDDAGVRVTVRSASECNQLPDGSFAETAPTTTTLTAKRVVLAIPPALVRDIRLELPATARAFVDGVRTGGVVKVFVAYARPFWRDGGWSGEVYRPTGTVRATIANGSALVAFVVGREAARWATRDPEDRRRDVIDTVAAEFGDAAREPVDYLEADWAADPWSRGCVASTPVGVTGAWGDAFGRVHIAGTEAARVWTGYMDGAIEAGERAASEVIGLLRE